MMRLQGYMDECGEIGPVPVLSSVVSAPHETCSGGGENLHPWRFLVLRGERQDWTLRLTLEAEVGRSQSSVGRRHV